MLKKMPKDLKRLKKYLFELLDVRMNLVLRMLYFQNHKEKMQNSIKSYSSYKLQKKLETAPE